MRVLKLEVNGLKSFENNGIIFDFFAEKRVRNDEIQENVFEVKPHLYTLNTLSLVGINASGKTTALNIIQGLLSVYLNNESIGIENRIYTHFESKLNVKIFLTDNNLIYKVDSEIVKDSLLEEIWFENEKVMTKKLNSSFKKSEIYDESGYTEVMERKEIENHETYFLKKDDSIFSGILNQHKIKDGRVYDTMGQTNFNYLSTFLVNESMPFIEYLDSSIEEFSRVKNKEGIEGINFKVKFKNSDKPIICDIIDLEKYLSSGTIKGINILSKVVRVLNCGGYLIIDELENHLNKRIITSILEFFLSDINRNGATLIFSTHYVEVLDSIDRNDSIYVLNKKENISIEKLSHLLGKNDRNDKKKSDIFLSGMVNTVPNYKHYRNIKKNIRTYLDNNGN